MDIFPSILRINLEGLSCYPIPIKTVILLLGIGIILTKCTQQQPVADNIDFEKEQAAIEAVIAKETESYYKQDFEAWKSTYLQSPAFRKFGYWEGYPEKVVSYLGFESLATEKKKQFDNNETLWQGSTEERTNENFRISNDMAWYTFEQNSYEKDTRKFLGKSMETRILEKQNGEWKIAYLGFHYYPMPVENN
ncbi:MAG: hypothetical protein KDC57_06065 [Saprospiraceae bacterium]|nr:hypothetical protein [Saprospiraceae bacterium]